MFEILRKYSRNFIIFLLVIGASLTLGLLSFSGMFLIFPIIGIAVASFFLATLYEGEIFWQNIKNVFEILFTTNALKTQLMREFLYETVKAFASRGDKLPPIIQHYLSLVKQLDNIRQHATKYHLTVRDKAYRELLLQKISRFEHCFTEILFELDKEGTVPMAESLEEDKLSIEHRHKKAIREWMYSNGGYAYRSHYRARYTVFTASKVFSLFAGAVVTVGTGFLLFEAFVTVPFLAFMPVVILPGLILGLAIVSGLAYTLITYNSIVSMINDRTLQQFVQLMREDFKQGWSWRNALKGLGAFVLFGLAVFLTVCTAGTWWTIGKNLSFIFAKAWRLAAVFFMAIAEFVKVLFNSICTWFGMRAALSHSHNVVEKASEADVASSGGMTKSEHIKAVAQKVWDRLTAPVAQYDTPAQRYNPFRFLLILILLPLNILFFLAHVISIGVTGDQMQGIPLWVSTGLIAASETIEDKHRIPFSEDECHCVKDEVALLKSRCESGGGHEHTLNLPMRLIQILLTPIYLFAILWDFTVIANHRKADESLWECFKKATRRQYGMKETQAMEDLALPQQGNPKDLEFKQFDALLIVSASENRLTTALRGKAVAREKLEALETYKQLIEKEALDIPNAPENIMQACNERRYTFFKVGFDSETTTAHDLKALCGQVNLTVMG